MASRAVEYTDSWWLIDDEDDHEYDRWVEVTLRYLDAAPFEVIALWGGDEDGEGTGAEWYQIGRDVLAAGLKTPSGHGLVKVWPYSSDYLRVSIVDPDRGLGGWTWAFLAPRVHVEEFLAGSFALVPSGDESWHLDVPDDVAELLEGSGG